MDTFTGAKPVESESVAGRDSPAALVGAGISLIVVVGLIHLIDAPEDLEPLGVLSLVVEALFVGIFLAIFVRPAKEDREAGSSAPEIQQGGRS
jgi:hypothetical protein